MGSVLRRIGGAVGGVVGFVLGSAWFLLMIGLFIGGISYRKECVTAEQLVKHDWTFTWLAPIPYLFRPSEPGCIIHTGTRVALNEVGIAKFEPTTAALVAEKFAKDSGGEDSAYFVQARAAVGEYLNRNRDVKSLAESRASIDELQDRLTSLEPPPAKYAEGHAQLIEALEIAERTGERLRRAGERGDREAYERDVERIESDALRIQTAMQELGVLANP